MQTMPHTCDCYRSRANHNLGGETRAWRREGIGRTTFARSNHQSRGRALISHNLISQFSATAMSTTTTISVSAPADFHVHLRQGDLSHLVTPHVRRGGFRLAYVMVNVACQNHLVVDLLRSLTSQTSHHPSAPRLKH